MPKEDGGVFPLNLLAQTKRGYLATVGRQMNGAYGIGWYDAAAVMMRRPLEISIIEAFEAKQVEDHIKDADGNYLQLSALVAKTLAEPKLKLSRNAKKALPKLKDVGHMSAHGRYFQPNRSVTSGFGPHVEFDLRPSHRNHFEVGLILETRGGTRWPRTRYSKLRPGS